MKVRIITFLVLCSSLSALSQDIPIYTQYFANPYIYNPAYAGLEGRPTFSIAHRRQWLGIEDSPITYNFTFHSPIILGFNMGVNVTQDNYGIFQSNSALLTFGYTVDLGFNHFLSFGISGGVGNQRVDPTDLNLNDPALGDVLDQGAYLDGNAGLAYHIGGLNIGFALPRVFKTSVYPTQDFDTGELGLIRNYIVTIDYMFYFGTGSFAFQPYGLYRSYEGFDPQFEGGGIVHLNNLLWFGGAYRQDFGVAGLIGLKLNGVFSAGYSYEMPLGASNGINQTSHEIQLTFAFGKKNNRSKKHATFVASEQPVKATPRKKEVKKPEIVEEEPADTVAIKEPEVIVPVVVPVDTVTTVPVDTTTHEVVPVVETVPEIEEPIEDELGPGPAVIARRGYHPFEMEAGHFVVVAAYGEFKNAVRYNDELLAAGYDSDFGFNTDKKLFYVFVYKGEDSDSTRSKRNEMRNDPKLARAWYLLVK
jgi:type IX secretion system PorP/SprF family membrane protein